MLTWIIRPLVGVALCCSAAIRATYFRNVSRGIATRIKLAFTLMISMFLVGAALPAKAQVQTIIADPAPQGSPCTGDVLTKNIGFFTSTTLPSIIVGRGTGICSHQGGLFLTRSTGGINGPWITTTISPGGDHYERAVAYTYKGDTYPGLITAEGTQTKWYYNPLNWGGDVTQPWASGIIHPSRACHDMHLADIDGDGQLDVICSADEANGTGGFIAFFNAYNNWEDHNDIVDAGDGIGIIRINGVWDIVTAHDGQTWLYVNPLGYGQNARTTPWKGYPIGSGMAGNSVEGGMLNGVTTIFEASNEAGTEPDGEIAGPWPQGFGMFQPSGPDITQPWKFTEIDPSQRDIHQIDAAVYPQGEAAYDKNGNPTLPIWLNGVLTGEQEQASRICNTAGYDDHPSILGCRVTYFTNNNDGSFSPLLLANLGTQNQSIVFYDGQIAAAGANHQAYGGYPPLQIWLFSPTNSGSTFQPGTYVIGNPYVIDGGFYQTGWGYPPAAEAYPNNQPNPWQQFTFAPSGNGFTICNVTDAACLSDGGNVVEIGQGTDTWAVISFGSGWALLNSRTGKYMGAIPTTVRANVAMSSTPVSLALTSSPTVDSFQPGTYIIGAPSVIDGGFQGLWGYPPAANVYPNNQPNPWQQFIFAPSGSGFTICNVPDAACLTDGGDIVDIGQGADTWTVTTSGSGWALLNSRTGQYMGSIPTSARANVTMSSSPVSITLTARAN